MSSPEIHPPRSRLARTIAWSAGSWAAIGRRFARSSQRKRSMMLDCIRGVAITSVVVYHVAKEWDRSTLDPVASIFDRYGLLGVDIFFPLSGFLICRYLLHSTTRESIGVFFERRFFRILPLYLAAVTIFVAASLLLGYESGNIDRIWITYFFLTGWFIFFEGGPAHVPYTITWSLSVEEFSYIVFGLCALWSRRALVAFLVFSSVAALALRIWLNTHGFEGVYNFPPARLDSIAMGGLAALLLDRRTRGLVPALGVAAVLTYGVALAVPGLWSSLKYTFITLGTCFLIVLFETRLRETRIAALSWLSSIGFYSYFTYLFHLFNIHALLLVVRHVLPGGRLDGIAAFWGVALASLALTHAQAVLSFRLFEGPLIQYGRGLEGSTLPGWFRRPRGRDEAVAQEGYAPGPLPEAAESEVRR